MGGGPVRPTRISSLVLIAVICAVGTWLVLHPVYVGLPPLPWTGIPALVLLAIAEAWSGRTLRARLRRGVGRPVHPIAVARMAALAKASSLAGAVIAGLAGGFLVYVAGGLGKAAYRADSLASGGTFAAAVLLVLAALYLEYGCRVPDSGHKHDESRPGPPGPR